MAAGAPVQDLCDEATCPVCLDYFADPVILAGCGHNFCRACLSRYWGGKEDGAASCPQCRGPVLDRNLIPNRPLANLVPVAKKLRLQGQGGAREAAEGVCEKHQEPLKFFCEDDKVPICVVCNTSKVHRPHMVVPRKDAFQEYKDQLCSRLKILRAERDKILMYRADAEEESQVLLNQTEAERQKTMAAFRQMRQFLEEEEKRLLAQVEEVEKEIARRRDAHLARLSEELSSLENVIQEMEEKCQQPASEFQQDIGRTLQRTEKKEAFRNPVAFPPELTCRIWEFYNAKPLLERVMQQFPAHAVNVTLDPDTANPRLILSEDGKSVRFGEEDHDLPDNPERFDFWPSVLGCEGFTSGRLFWEVTVGSEGRCAVGVARRSVRRKGWFDFNPKGGIWAVEKLGDHCKVLGVSHYIPLSSSQELRRIRVTLNCADGQVVFSDADTGVHLYTFPGALFCGETLFPYFQVDGEAHLELSP